MKIQQIFTDRNHELKVISEDGIVGFFDVKPYLNAEAFIPLRDLAEFRKIRNGGYYVSWDCGADMSADTIFARLVVEPESN